MIAFSSLVTVFVFLLGICWGSFLYLIADRLVREAPLLYQRSYCPHCEVRLLWYDMIPLLSWCFLRARCRACSARLSFYYIVSEIVTGIIAVLLFHKLLGPYVGDGLHLFKYSYQVLFRMMFFVFFFSNLIIASLTDVRAMVVYRVTTLWVIPIGLFGAWCGVLDISFLESLLGIGVGYGFLAFIAYVFYRITGKEGLGKGDCEMLAVIGAFLGPIGAWISLLLGSFLGLVMSLPFLFVYPHFAKIRIPFIPFLASGALVFVVWRESLMTLFLS